jgi:hypothetical protein
MPALYIDTDFVDAFIGESVREDLFDDGAGYVSANFTVLATVASERVRGWASSSGYETQMGDTTTDYRVMLATVGVFIPLAYARPSKTLPLPEDWDAHPSHTAIEEIQSGKMKLEVDPATATAVGGMLFTSATSRPAKADRDEMAGY